MLQRPAWWLVLGALAALAVAAPFWSRSRGVHAPLVEPARVTTITTRAAPATTAAAELDAAASAAPEVRAVWPANAKSVLHVGDSSLGFTQGLALEMSKRFDAVGIVYESHTEASAGLHSFAVSKKLEELVRQKTPDVVLLTLGMNNLTSLHPEQYEVDVRSLVEQVGSRPCFWIGPLSIERPENGLIAMLARATAPCAWTSSYELVLERQSDAIHPTQRGASKWADAIWNELGAPTPHDQ
jgi:lysophospholipase L1-like esterase